MMIDALADYLQLNGLGVTGTDLFVGFLPAEPDAVTVLYSTGGPAPELRRPYELPSFQVRTRGTNARTAYDRCKAVYERLHGLHDTQLGVHYLVDCYALQSSPVAIGRDEAGRYEYTLNFQARIHRA
jgi:hypothetical protein